MSKKFEREVKLYIVIGFGDGGSGGSRDGGYSDIIMNPLGGELYIFDIKKKAKEALKVCQYTWPTWDFEIVERTISVPCLI